jgi:hypothetical protein
VQGRFSSCPPPVWGIQAECRQFDAECQGERIWKPIQVGRIPRELIKETAS